MTPLPNHLSYLEPSLRELSKIPADELNEDVDVSMLEVALWNRVKGLSIRDAQKRIAEDHAALQNWLKSSNGDASHVEWIIGFLGHRPGALARQLLAPPLPPDPKIEFEPPAGWSVERVPLSLHLHKGRKKMGYIIVTDASRLKQMLRKNQIRDEIESRNENSFTQVKWTNLPVQFGECHGYKYLYLGNAQLQWKSVEYLLEVPGGAIHAKLDAGGKNFDESPVEAQLHTLLVIQPGAS